MFLSKTKIFKLSIGSLISKRSFLAQDEASNKGINELAKLISEGKGVSVFFAHLGLVDVFSTAMVLEQNMAFKAVFPVAASWFNFPGLNNMFKQINKQVPYKFIPVFRKEEMGYSKEDINFINFSGLSYEQKKSANKNYLSHAKDVLNKGGMVILAPYGGRATKLQHLRSGPVRNLQNGSPVIFSFTHWDWKKIRYNIYFSKVYCFEKSIDKEKAHKAIYTEFIRMAKLAKVSRKTILESKSGSFISRGLWKVISTIILTFHKGPK